MNALIRQLRFFRARSCTNTTTTTKKLLDPTLLVIPFGTPNTTLGPNKTLQMLSLRRGQNFDS